MTDIEYIREEDKQEYRNFCVHHIPSVARKMPDEVWHYTNADGLIGILKTGKIFATQIACLNDTMEQRYFGDLVHDAVKKLKVQNTDPKLKILLNLADEALEKRDFSSSGHFVTSFSEVKDDLGQWRGYGGGECGYAIGFHSEGILEALKSRSGALFAPMNYEDNTHKFLVDDVLRMAQIYFAAGLARGLPDVDRWSREFFMAFAQELDVFASTTKHPKFFSELERRIVTLLQPGEHKALEFRQKRTLLARHLPLDLTIGSPKLLPITRIYIGPGPAKQVSRISVGDLLLKYDYTGIRVELSEIPYRIP